MFSAKKYINLIRNINNWPSYFTAKYFDSSQDPVKFTARHQVQVEVPKGGIMPIFKEIFMEDLYEIDFLKKRLPDSPVIVDVGANVGFFSLFMASQFPKASVYAFEPLPGNFNHLQKHFQLNPDKKLVAQNKAVAGSKGTLTLHYNPEVNFTALASMHTTFDASNTKQVEVESVSLPDIFTQFNLQKIDLLKLDCEGAEYDILYQCPAALFSSISQIAMETHAGKKQNENTESLATYLRQQGYELKSNANQFIWAWRK
jgi:FkbM family methyltransferase